MPPINVVSDANVVLKWFHAEGEQDVHAARALLDRYRARRIGLFILDLTIYEVGNALLRGRGLPAASVTTVLEALGELVPRWIPRPTEWVRASAIATTSQITFYAAMYAAVAEQRGALLATEDSGLLAAGFGQRPAALVGVA